MRSKLFISVLFLLLLGGSCYFIFDRDSRAPEVRPNDWPLWDGHESIADYAKKTNLPEHLDLLLPDKETLRLNLIPACKFQMGNPIPIPESPRIGAAVATLSGLMAILLVLYAWIMTPKGIRFSLRLYMLFIGMLSLTAFGVVKHQKAVAGYQELDPNYKYAYNQVFEQNHFWANEQPAHDCVISKPYYLGCYEISQDQYGVVTSFAPSTFLGTNLPVDNVTWLDAQAFCNKASDFLHRTVRLPTETEWEFACKASLSYQPPHNQVELEKVCWYSPNSAARTHPVGKKAPNKFGLYDMLGNVGEWCSDSYREDAYRYAKLVDPQGPSDGTDRLSRGGSWNSSQSVCTDTCRGDRYWQSTQQGFRVVVECDAAKLAKNAEKK